MEISEPRGRSTIPSVGEKGARSERCPQLAKMGICFEGARCQHQHPPGVQLARAEPCPFGGNSREACPLRNLCAFTHGEAEQRCPPIFRARGNDPAGDEDGLADAAHVVRRSLGQSMDQTVALLAEARALGLVDDVRSAERRLQSSSGSLGLIRLNQGSHFPHLDMSWDLYVSCALALSTYAICLCNSLLLRNSTRADRAAAVALAALASIGITVSDGSKQTSRYCWHGLPSTGSISRLDAT